MPATGLRVEFNHPCKKLIVRRKSAIPHYYLPFIFTKMAESIQHTEQISVVPEQPVAESNTASNTSSNRRRTSDPIPSDPSALTTNHDATNTTKRQNLTSDGENDRPTSNISSKISKGEKRQRRQARQLTKKQKKAARNSRITIKATEWSYLKLEIILIPSSAGFALPETLDLITLYTLLQSALKRYLGIIGSSLHFDILHVDNLTVFLRVPSTDFSPFWAAMSGYYVDANATSGFKIVDGCSKVGITIAKTSKFLNGVTGPPRKWVPPTAPIAE
ncbi:uncharacterized protein V1513DRAFT_486323 [Lipomyces chichibuensis]|uniref:uncharacterized protein n=1 Tax=Lipomyces chichibuensis TaxID=1546026 RepID=UPI0033437901